VFGEKSRLASSTTGLLLFDYGAHQFTAVQIIRTRSSLRFPSEDGDQL
jgi:hypothetical protein